MLRAKRRERARSAVAFGSHSGILIAPHAFIKKAQKTPPEEMGIAHERMKGVLS
jgi:phage-related protein